MPKMIPLILVIFIFTAMVVSDEKEEVLAIHDTLHCKNCHLMNSDVSSRGELSERSAACRNCHDPLKSNANNFGFDFHDNQSRDCTDCHSFHKTEIINAKESRFAIDYYDDSKKYNCVGCHSKNSSLIQLSEGHKAAALLYHSDSLYAQQLSASGNCMVCHSLNSSMNIQSLNSGKLPFINLHASHPNEITLDKSNKPGMRNMRNAIDSRIKLQDNRIECLTCHSLTSKSKKLLVQLDKPEDLCSGCHVRRQNDKKLTSIY